MTRHSSHSAFCAGLPRPAPAPGIWAGLPDPLPLGRADRRQTVRFLGDVVTALPSHLRGRQRLSVPPRRRPSTDRPGTALGRGHLRRVSIHPIRHSADAKPYASDLLVALGLLALAIEWYRSPQRTGWLWLLVGFAPIALAASYPAVLVAGGIALALAPSVWMTRRRGPMIALAAYVLVVATTFAALFVGFAHRQQGPGTMRRSPELLGRFFPTARFAGSAGELADQDPRRQHVRLSWRGQPRGEQRDVDPRADRRGGLLAAGPTDDPVAPGDADGGRARGGGAQALSLRRPGADHAVSRARHLPDGRVGPEHRSGLSAPARTPEPRHCESRPSRWPSWGSSCWRKTFGTRTGPSTITRPASSPGDSGPSKPEAPSVACLRVGLRRSPPEGRRCPHGALPLQSTYLFARPKTRRPVQTGHARRPTGRSVAWSSTTQCSSGPRRLPGSNSMKNRFVLRGRSKVVVPTTGLDQKPWTDHLTVLEFLPRPDRPTRRSPTGSGTIAPRGDARCDSHTSTARTDDSRSLPSQVSR